MMHLQIIVFVWSQYDDGNIEQRTIGYGCRQNQEAKLKIVGGEIPWSNQQEALLKQYNEMYLYKDAEPLFNCII